MRGGDRHLGAVGREVVDELVFELEMGIGDGGVGNLEHEPSLRRVDPEVQIGITGEGRHRTVDAVELAGDPLGHFGCHRIRGHVRFLVTSRRYGGGPVHVDTAYASR